MLLGEAAIRETDEAFAAAWNKHDAKAMAASWAMAVRVACTIDLLIHPNVESKLAPHALADAVYNALQDGRMRLLPEHLDYVVALIGHERAALCRSLPRTARSSYRNL